MIKKENFWANHMQQQDPRDKASAVLTSMIEIRMNMFKMLERITVLAIKKTV